MVVVVSADALTRNGAMLSAGAEMAKKLDMSLSNILCLNSLAPGRFEQNFRLVIFKLISVAGGWDIYCKIALR